MCERGKSKSFVKVILYVCICAAFLFSSGCSACVKALARELMDDGKYATIKNKSFASHFKDAVLEDLSGIQPVVDKSKN
jgi:hypothetical protein